MVYTIDFIKQLRHLWEIIIYLIIDVGAVFYMVHIYGKQDLHIFVLLASIAFLIIFIPTIKIHLEYYIKNRNSNLKVNYKDKVVEYEHKGNKTTFQFEDIQLIDQYRTPALIEKRVGWLPWESYNYAKVKLKDGKQLIITCFLIDEFELPIDKAKIKIHKVFYPNIKNW
jgi:hypothetical protein